MVLLIITVAYSAPSIFRQCHHEVFKSMSDKTRPPVRRMSSTESFQSALGCLSVWLIIGLVFSSIHQAIGQLDPIRGAPPPPTHTALERYFNLLNANRRYSSRQYFSKITFHPNIKFHLKHEAISTVDPLSGRLIVEPGSGN